MKKAFVYLLFFSGLISLFSCEDTDYQIYDKSLEKTNKKGQMSS